MGNPEDNFKINLNQNLWGLVVGLVSLGTAEHFCLPRLLVFSCIITSIMTLSIAVTTLVYTINYCKKKSTP